MSATGRVDKWPSWAKRTSRRARAFHCSIPWWNSCWSGDHGLGLRGFACFGFLLYRDSKRGDITDFCRFFIFLQFWYFKRDASVAALPLAQVRGVEILFAISSFGDGLIRPAPGRRLSPATQRQRERESQGGGVGEMGMDLPWNIWCRYFPCICLSIIWKISCTCVSHLNDVGPVGRISCEYHWISSVGLAKIITLKLHTKGVCPRFSFISSCRFVHLLSISTWTFYQNQVNHSISSDPRSLDG